MVVMILLLSGDNGMNRMRGDVGELPFRIKREDLAARRFDHAVVHLES